MVAINKEETEAIRKRFPYVHIVRTMKQKSKRHRYYCEETGAVMKYLETLRSTKNYSYVTGDIKEIREGVSNRDRKKSK